MKDHNLDDLIIDDAAPKSNKAKGLLTIIALLIAILIVAIVLTRIILGDSDENGTVTQEPQGELISPELKLDTTDESAKAEEKDLEQLSTMMEEELTSESTSKEEVPAAAAEPTPPEESKAEAKPTPQVAEPSPQPSPEIPAITAAPETAAKEKTAIEKAEEVPEKPAKTEKKSESAVPAAAVAKTPAPKKSEPQASGSYYIQVGSFSKEPSKQFLSIIGKSGFSYKIHHFKHNGKNMGKLLIGPYRSREAAGKELPRVKDRINKSAFIIHL